MASFELLVQDYAHNGVLPGPIHVFPMPCLLASKVIREAPIAWSQQREASISHDLLLRMEKQHGWVALVGQKEGNARLILESPLPVEMPERLALEGTIFIGWGKSICLNAAKEEQQEAANAEGLGANGPQPASHGAGAAGDQLEAEELDAEEEFTQVTSIGRFQPKVLPHLLKHIDKEGHLNSTQSGASVLIRSSRHLKMKQAKRA